MSKLRSVLALAVLIVVAGCAASGPLYSEIAPTIPSVPSDRGRVYFYRANTIFGAAVTSDITLSKRVVGKSERGSFFYVDENPGNLVASVSTEVERQLSFTLTAGETKYIKSSVSMGVLVGRVNLELASPNDAKTEITELHYTGGAVERARAEEGAVEQPKADGEAVEEPKDERPTQRGGRRRKFQSASPPAPSP